MELVRYDPRKHRDMLKELVQAFEYRAFEPIKPEDFLKELDKRALDLLLRNSIVLAFEEDVLLGAGFFTIWTNHLGQKRCEIHQVIVRKEDSFKKGIEETIMKELLYYVKSAMNISKVYLYCRNSDINFKSLLMKMGIKKQDIEYFEHQL
jgi:ribosomal protein S18 acetylase RimI-like enzyme